MRTDWLLNRAAARIDRFDAEVLLAHVLGCERLKLLLDTSAAVEAADFDGLVDRRAAGEPVAYITGHREFWSLDLLVMPGVLIPRPDSETLIEAALAHFGGRAPATILDLGTGSGALLLSALSEWPTATGTGVDISAAALAVAQANAERLGLQSRARFVEGGWDYAPDRFDLILCNPPYIATDGVLPRDVLDWEPHTALFAGRDGLDAYRQLAPSLGERLAPGGVACVEIGSTQAESAGALFTAAGLRVALRRDLAGLSRCLIITK